MKLQCPDSDFIEPCVFTNFFQALPFRKKNSGNHNFCLHENLHHSFSRNFSTLQTLDSSSLNFGREIGRYKNDENRAGVLKLHIHVVWHPWPPARGW